MDIHEWEHLSKVMTDLDEMLSSYRGDEELKKILSRMLFIMNSLKNEIGGPL